jgi:hypothetical protein
MASQNTWGKIKLKNVKKHDYLFEKSANYLVFRLIENVDINKNVNVLIWYMLIWYGK